MEIRTKRSVPCRKHVSASRNVLNGIVFHGLSRLRFHHGHVLVRRGMENGLRLISPENLLQSRLILNVRRQRDEQIAVTGVDQFLFDLEQLHLRLLHEEERVRRIRSDLPAQFAADAAAGTRHHDHAVPQEVPDVFRRQPHLFAPQPVFSFHGPQLADFGLACGEFVNGRHSAELDSQPLKRFDNFRHAPGRRARHGDDHFLQFQIRIAVQQTLRCADHLDIVHVFAPFYPVVVEEGDRLQTEVAPRGEFLRQRRSHQARANDMRRAR